MFFKRFLSKFPYMIGAMIVGNLVAFFLNTLESLDTTHIKTVGALPAHLPPLSYPDLSLNTLHHIFFPALVVTMLALTEASPSPAPSPSSRSSASTATRNSSARACPT
jgi:SulP family sulfate permease